MASDQLKQKLDYLTQMYFESDKPIPWLDGLIIYPVLVDNYYQFHVCVDCLTADKNKDISGVGISMSHLSYLIYRMTNKETGRIVTNQFITMMEMVFRIKNGLYCDNPECCNYQDVPSFEMIPTEQDEQDEQNKSVNHDEKSVVRVIKPYTDVQVLEYDEIWKNFESLGTKEEQAAYLQLSRICPHCGKPMREVLTISKNETGKDVLYIYDTCINAKAYDELRQIICRYNMLDWDDAYIDPELERDLALKAKLENKDMVSPTLEKQKAVLCVRTAYKLEELDNLTLRKLAMLIRTSDSVLHYQIYRSASMSGLVTFKSEIKHYLYSSDKKNIMDEMIDANKFKDSLKEVMA